MSDIVIAIGVFMAIAIGMALFVKPSNEYCLNCQQKVKASKGFSWTIFLLFLIFGLGVGAILYTTYFMFKRKTCSVCGGTNFGESPERHGHSNKQNTEPEPNRQSNQSTRRGATEQQESVDCENCGASVSPQANFCGECGIDLSSGDNNGQRSEVRQKEKRGKLNDGNTAVQQSVNKDKTSQEQTSTEPTVQKETATRKQSDRQQEEQAEQTNQQTATSETMDNDSEPEQQSTVVDAAENITEQTQFDSTAAQQLCETLSDPEADQSQVESVLSDAVSIIESATATKQAVATVTDPSNTRELESAKQELARINGNLAATLTPIIDQTLTLENDVSERATQHDQLRNAAGAVCRAAENNSEIVFQTNDTTDRTQELADKLRSGELQFADPQRSIPAMVDDMRQSLRPRTEQSQMLVDTLADPSQRELRRVLDTTVKTVDEHTRMHEMLAEIGTEDVKRRIDSLDRELSSQDRPVYTHLADRVRELEAQIDDAQSVDEIQLYAIYQEISYYDRTLLPRLSRSQSSSGSADTQELLTTVERRVDEINDNFVSVRPDHNHTIPKHFIGLAEELADRARQEQRDNPEQATGVLVAADTVLDYVEQLYTQNEYSVMLRRLRG